MCCRLASSRTPDGITLARIGVVRGSQAFLGSEAYRIALADRPRRCTSDLAGASSAREVSGGRRELCPANAVDQLASSPGDPGVGPLRHGTQSAWRIRPIERKSS